MLRRAGRLAASAACLGLLVPLAAGPAQASSVPVVFSTDLSSRQWQLDAVHAHETWPVSRGAGVKVAVLDAGFAPTHPEFAGQLAPFGYVAYTPHLRRVASSSMYDMHGHGTHVAGIIAASDDSKGTSGVAPGATLVPVKMTAGDFDEALWRSPDFAQAARFDELFTALAADGVRVANLSWGEPVSRLVAPADMVDDPICKAVTHATDLGIVVVVASGNAGQDDNQVSLPAACPDALSVGALGRDLSPADFTTFNSAVDVAAPGVDILSTTPAGAAPAFYARMSGTSMAAPVVSGVAALLIAAQPDLAAREVAARIVATARDVYAPGVDTLTGSGLVDAAAALGVPAAPYAPGSLLRVWWDSSQRGVLHWRSPQAKVLDYQVDYFRFETGSSVPPARQSWTVPADRVGFELPALVAKQLSSGDWLTLTAHLDGQDPIVTTVLYGNARYPSGFVPGHDFIVPDLAARWSSGVLAAHWGPVPRLIRAVVCTFTDNTAMVDSVVTHSLEADGSVPSTCRATRTFPRSDEVEVSVTLIDADSVLSHDASVTVPARQQVSWSVRTLSATRVRVVGTLAGAACPSLDLCPKGSSVRVRIGTGRHHRVRTLWLSWQGSFSLVVPPGSRLSLVGYEKFPLRVPPARSRR